ncbi:unnamed protein product [Tetraodon nigroviridis]|uniref:Chromosome undetermined SCAF8771, whole genome shotgun sequence n=1 Tax=Tetraodon nigroviridis TaxID=99883 RepID=Q4T6G2_TETNG|nr:unnamed protein product [Tetraodon nigroviridis]
MLDPDPTGRITPDQLLQHGFLTNTDGASPSKQPEPTAGVEKGQRSFVQNSRPQQSPKVQSKTTKRKHESLDKATGPVLKRARISFQFETAEEAQKQSQMVHLKSKRRKRKHESLDKATGPVLKRARISFQFETAEESQKQSQMVHFKNQNNGETLFRFQYVSHQLYMFENDNKAHLT